jgi:hypothetical protein
MVEVNRCGGVADGGVVAEVFGGLVRAGGADAEFAEAGVAAGLLLEGQRGELGFGGARCPASCCRELDDSCVVVGQGGDAGLTDKHVGGHPGIARLCTRIPGR